MYLLLLWLVCDEEFLVKTAFCCACDEMEQMDSFFERQRDLQGDLFVSFGMIELDGLIEYFLFVGKEKAIFDAL